MYRFLVFLCVLALAAAAPASAGGSVTHLRIALSDLGYDRDPQQFGEYPRFKFDLPVTPAVESVQMHLMLRTGPDVDGASYFSILADDRTVAGRSVENLRTSPSMDVVLPVRRGERIMHVAVEARLFGGNNACKDIAAKKLWASIGRESFFRVALRPQKVQPFVGFLVTPYTSEIRIVVAGRPSVATWAAVTRLAYDLHRLQRWRARRVTTGERPESGALNIVIGDFPKEAEVVNNTLRLAYRTVETVGREIEALPATAEDWQYGGGIRRIPASATEEVSGIGALPIFFSIDQVASRGTPLQPMLRVSSVHSAFSTADPAFLKVYVNGSLAGVRPLNSSAGPDVTKFMLPSDVLRATNVVSIVPTYVPTGEACKTGAGTFRYRLLEDTALTWRDDGPPVVPNIGDFLSGAHGRLVVAIADPLLLKDAFALLDRLGSINTAVTSVDVQPYDWHVPPGYDYAIAIVHSDDLYKIQTVFHHDFTLPTLAEKATPQQIARIKKEPSYAFMQTAVIRNTPTLVISYRGDADVISAVADLPIENFALEGGNVLFYAHDGILYGSPAGAPLWQESYGDHLRRSMVPVGVGFGFAVLFIIQIASRRPEPKP